MQRSDIGGSDNLSGPTNDVLAASAIPVRPAFSDPTKRVMAVFGVKEEAFEAGREPQAVACKVVTAAILILHLRHGESVIADYLSIPRIETGKIVSLFRSFFLTHAVPREMDVGALALKLKSFFQGREDRIDFRSFAIGRPQFSIVEGGETDGRVSTAEIIRVVSEYLDVPVADIKSDRRAPQMVCARRIAMYATRYLTPCSFPMIGRMMGGRDHSTVIYACNTLESKIGGRPPEGLNLKQLLAYIKCREPEAAELHRAALLCHEKRQKAYNDRTRRDMTFLEAA